MNALKKLCCSCWGEEDSSNVPYERMPQADIRPVREAPRRRETNSINYDAVDGSQAAGTQAPVQDTEKTVEERETEALNRILQSAQDSIIDVGHLHHGGLGTRDYIDRAREYEEALLTYHTRLRHQRSGNSVRIELPGPSTGRRILDDCGNRAADWLGKHNVSQTQYQQAIEHGRQVDDTLSQIKVVPKQSLLIEMGF